MTFKNLTTTELPLFITEENAKVLPCEGCRNGEELEFDFSMAFQPLVDLADQKVFGYEGLVRGLNNEPAGTIIGKVTANNIYRFDQVCRVKAIALAAKANLSGRLNINFLPGAVYKPDICIRTTLAVAEKYQFPCENITFEVVESEHIQDTSHLQKIIEYYKKIGFSVALDDFGAGHANLGWLAELEPDSIKIDMNLIRNIDSSTRKQHILTALSALCKDLNIGILAEGVETKAERDVLAELGITKQQGYFFSPPQFETFPDVSQDKFL
ncbi:EAL domain-containing protein [Alteromonas sp. ZYF713]|nr:EAL domain-containing protein [Alteromonas sp. ZYF713]